MKKSRAKIHLWSPVVIILCLITAGYLVFSKEYKHELLTTKIEQKPQRLLESESNSFLEQVKDGSLSETFNTKSGNYEPAI